MSLLKAVSLPSFSVPVATFLPPLSSVTVPVMSPKVPLSLYFPEYSREMGLEMTLPTLASPLTSAGFVGLTGSCSGAAMMFETV